MPSSMYSLATNSCVFNTATRGKECVYPGTNRLNTARENGIQTSSFFFRSPTTLEMGIQFFVFVFRFPITLKTKLELLFSFFPYGFVQQNCNCHFWFSVVLSRFRVILCYLRQKPFKQTLALFRFVFIFSFPLTILKIDVITNYVTNCMYGVVIATKSTKNCVAIFIEN